MNTVARVVPVFLVLLIPFLLASCGDRVTDGEQFSPEEKIVMRFSHVVPQNTPKGLAAKRFARLVNERTGGRVEVQVFPNSTLYKDGEEFKALQTGKVHFIAPSTSKLGRMFPRWQLFDLPFEFETRREVHEAVNGPVGSELCRDLKQQDMKALAFWDNGFKQLTNDKRELRLPSDCAGLNFRVMINSRLLEDQFRALGANPVPMPFSEVYRGLENGVIDGQENTMSNIYSKKFYRQQEYLTVSNHGYLGYVVLTSARFWEELPGDVRTVLKNTMEEVTRWERQKAARMNQENYREMEQGGEIKIHILTARERERWKQQLEPLYEQYRPVIGKDLIDSIN